MLKREDRSHWLEFLLVCTGIVVYLNSFSGVFLFDDRARIFESIHLPRLDRLGYILAGPRPFLHFTFAVNHALGGLEVWGYHLVNLGVHLLAALTLFGILRRTLATESLQARYGNAASFLAFAISLLWMVHPLQTQSVTYLIQRAESLMGLFYLLTLYCVIRGNSSPRPRRWYAAAFVSSFLGMTTKEVMVTAPLVILIYDRIFLSHSWREVFKKRTGLYLGLIATWGILVATSFRDPSALSKLAGFGYEKISPLEYALTQPSVVLHYLKLVFWPHPLVIDYAWPVAKEVKSILPPLVVIVLLLGTTLITLGRKPALGFLGVWFFLILAPTSSIMPIADLAFEHRMYLSLAAVTTLVVLMGYEGLKVLIHWKMIPAALGPYVTGSLLLVAAVTLGVIAIRRNQDYASEEQIWRDTVQKRPRNHRAHCNLGAALDKKGEIEEAIQHYSQALQIDPTYRKAHFNLAVALDKQGKLDDAISHYLEVLRLNPADVAAHSNLGAVLSQQGKFKEAINHYLEALRMNPAFAELYYNLGNALLKLGHFDEAILNYERALELKPGLKDARNNLQIAWAQKKRSEES